MRNPRLAITLTALLLVGLAAAASAGSRKFGCNANGKVFGYRAAYSGAFDVTLMWTNPSADNDLFVFDRQSSMLIGVGASMEPRFEALTVGAVPGVDLDVLVIKYDGPNSQCVLYVSCRDGDVAPPSSSRSTLRYRGNIEQLAQRDSRYEAMWQAYERAMEMKGGVPER